MANWLKRARCEIPAVEDFNEDVPINIDTAESARSLAGQSGPTAREKTGLPTADPAEACPDCGSSQC